MAAAEELSEVETVRRDPNAGQLEIGAREVLVASTRLDRRGEPTGSASAVLSADELARAARFRFARDRDAFLRAPGPYGKPALASGGDLEFNLSHSGSLALCALAWKRPVGVDVEAHRDDVETLEIAELFFSEREIETLRELPEAARRHAFFLCWTRKEAYVKARGEGLSVPLGGFDVTCVPGEPARLTGLGDAAEEVARWSIADLDVGPGYSAAVAAIGAGWRATIAG